MFFRQKPIEAAMHDDDRDALAAEYVLGTLSAEERDQAEALLVRDAEFAQTVRLWEHRLGELNVMVEAVEPPADVWERIKTGINGAERQSQAASDTVEIAGAQSEAAHGEVSPPGPEANDGSAEPNFQTVPDLLSGPAQSRDSAGRADLASALLPSEPAAEFEDRPPTSTAPQTAKGAEPATPDQNFGRWRALAIAASVIAVLLAVYIGIAHALGLMSLTSIGRQPQATTGAPKGLSAPQLVAVLQQEPTAPAFLVMLDPQQRTLTIRRLTAAPDSGRSYELWLNSNKLSKPVSLGPVGNADITTRPIPQNIDIETMRSATYSVSLEPGNGSTTGAPIGPMLFKGRMIEAGPGSAG
jgi:anti-sigma-K factor RskA